MRRSLGLTVYFRRFVPNYAKTARSISGLLQKDVSFLWGPKQENAFKELRTALVSEPILKLLINRMFITIRISSSGQLVSFRARSPGSPGPDPRERFPFDVSARWIIGKSKKYRSHALFRYYYVSIVVRLHFQPLSDLRVRRRNSSPRKTIITARQSRERNAKKKKKNAE